MSADFHFLRPLWLLALPLFWFAAWRYLNARQRSGAWSSVCDPALLPFVLEAGGGKPGRVGGWTLALAGTIAITALAGPVWERVPVPVFRSESALVIALDLSSSMNAEDISPSRLARARYKVADILRLRTSGQTALVVFAAQSFVVTPLTDDNATLAAQLQALDSSIMPNQGSEPVTAIKRAGELLAQAGVTGGQVLLITDGGDPAALGRAKTAAEDAPFRLSILGVGTAEGAPIPDVSGGFAKRDSGEIILNKLDRDALGAIAQAGGGQYFEVTTGDEDTEQVLQYVDARQADSAARLQDLNTNQWREFGPWLLLPLLPVAALAFRRGLLVMLWAVLLTLGAAPNSQADWFRTPDQAGQRAFDEGQYDAAAERFRDPQWRAAARYRAGDYAEVLADLGSADSPQAHYNSGNALARLGRLDEALAAYDKALEKHPDDADALHNRALVEALLKQQEQPPPQQKSGEKGESKEQKSDTGESGGESELSGGQDEQQAQNLSSGKGSGGADGEQTQAEQVGSGSESTQGADNKPAAEAENKSDEAKEAQANSQRAQGELAADAEDAQATEQWLRQIPDDPAGLLRRKFQYQYKQLYGNQATQGNPW